MTLIDEATLRKVCVAINGKPELDIELGCSLLPLVSLVVNAYESTKPPRTISREELDEALLALRYEEYVMGGDGHAGMRKALAALGITVEGE